MPEPEVQATTPTGRLADHLLAMREQRPSPEALTVGKQCLLDWLGVALAGRGEPLVKILSEEFASTHPNGGCTVLGLARHTRLEDAVLINGAMGHALDFDDVILLMGHPTAPVAPAVLAAAELMGASGEQTLRAFVAGVEAECCVARLMGPSHYAKGWHTTATFGAFGAAAGVAELLRLDRARLLLAFGLAGTMAAGLKSAFGTMAKPLHAGRAAQSGLIAARLAARSFTADTDILGSAQGFADTQSTSVNVETAFAGRAQPYVVDALFKYHAACYLTHNAIEAVNALRQKTPFRPTDVEAMTIQVQQTHMGVCNIEVPKTGLECKFSLRMTCALAAAGEDTFDERIFSDATAARPDLVRLCRQTRVEPTATGPGSTVTITLNDGRVLSETVDVAIPSRDLPAQQEKLERKFRHLTQAALGSRGSDRAVALVRELEHQHDLRELFATVAGR